MGNSIIQFFENNKIVSGILEVYLIFVIVLFLVRFCSKSKVALSLIFPIISIFVVHYIAVKLNFTTVANVVYYTKIGMYIVSIILLTPDIRQYILDGNKGNVANTSRTTTDSKEAIADAIMHLSSQKIGALITIEKHRLLDQYSEKAIIMNSDISKELLINIFSPLTPLHDGAVIIKGNKIRCAGAYYVLSQRDNLDKTVGSRHRAALGIAEVTDSVTIVVSEETGSVSIAYSGIFMKMTDRVQLLEYIDIAMEREV